MRSVSVSPHVRSGASTATIMRDVAIALTPSLVFGVFVFGLRALVIICLSIVTCLLTEYLWQRLMKLPVTVADGSALVTGMILAVNLPASVPWWIPVMGGVFAILVVKQLFGGIGQNIMNPALAARCFLVISFPALLGSRMPAVGQIFGSDMWAGFGQPWRGMPPPPPRRWRCCAPAKQSTCCRRSSVRAPAASVRCAHRPFCWARCICWPAA